MDDHKYITVPPTGLAESEAQVYRLYERFADHFTGDALVTLASTDLSLSRASTAPAAASCG